MRKPNNLLVLGCSVSDYTKVEKPWGLLLSEQLSSNYVHEAAGMGSNWRMWRTAFNLVNSKTITPDDTVVIQYTEVVRREFWSPYHKKAEEFQHDPKFKAVFKTEEYDNGVIIRFKSDSYKDKSLCSNERSFLEKYSCFVSVKFELEYFRMMHNMFQSFMKDNGFNNVYFLKVGMYGPLKSSDDLIECYKDNWIFAPNALDNHLPKDPYHMNQQGHENLASLVHKYITKA